MGRAPVKAGRTVRPEVNLSKREREGKSSKVP